MSDDRATLERIQAALADEAGQLETDPDKTGDFIAGMRYAVAFIGTRLPTAEDAWNAALESAANKADVQPAMSRAVGAFLRSLQREGQRVIDAVSPVDNPTTTQLPS